MLELESQMDAMLAGGAIGIYWPLLLPSPERLLAVILRSIPSTCPWKVLFDFLTLSVIF